MSMLVTSFFTPAQRPACRGKRIAGRRVIGAVRAVYGVVTPVNVFYR